VVVEIIFEAILSVVGRVIGYILIELIFQVICYLTGYAFLKIVTVGTYPKKFFLPGSDEKSDYGVCLVGFLVWALCIVSFIFFTP
jgi:hypothetical protein